MGMLGKFCLRLTVFVSLLGTGIQDLTINGCTDGWVTVEENSIQSILCRGGSSLPAAWRILGADNVTLVFSGTCEVGPCTSNGITLTQSGDSHNLIINKNRQTYDGFYVYCKVDSSESVCRIKIEGTANSSTNPEKSTFPVVVTTPNQPDYTGTSSSTETTLQTTSTAIQQNTQEQGSTTDKTCTSEAASSTANDGDGGKPLAWAAAVGGGLAAAFVIIVVIVIIIIVMFKRRLVSRKRGGDNRNDDVEEHINVVYEPGGQDNNHTSTAQQQAAINTTIIPAYDDDQLDDDEEIIGYTTVNLNPHARAAISTVNSSGSSTHTVVNRSAPGNAGVTHANSLPVIRQDLDLDETELTDEFDPNYSAVDVPRPKTFAAPSGTSSHGDVYAVPDKSAKGKKVPTFQPDIYAEVNKPKPNQAGDVYAEVDRSSKPGNSQVAQQNVDSGEGGYYAEVRKPRPDNKPTLAVKPVLKPNPTLQPKKGASPGNDPAEPGDYNILTFVAQTHHAGSEDDADQQYSHI